MSAALRSLRRYAKLNVAFLADCNRSSTTSGSGKKDRDFQGRIIDFYAAKGFNVRESGDNLVVAILSTKRHRGISAVSKDL